MKKLIGVTPRLLVEETTEKQFVNSSYVNYLLKYDCNIIMLTLNNPNVEEVLDLCDGFLITGGTDVDPKFYNEENTDSKGIDSRLDILDKQVVEYAVKTKKPLLGICRGHQSINVFLGGSLIQHMDNHRGIKDNHEVITTKNPYLDFDEYISTNSYHHQAVKDLAPNMEIIAKHKDGTCEAIIHKELPIIGVQWHPELMVGTKESKIIFDKFFDFINK